MQELAQLYLPGTRLDKPDAWRGCILRVSLWRHQDNRGWSVRLFAPKPPHEYYEELYATEAGAREALAALYLLGERLGTWTKEDTSWEALMARLKSEPGSRRRKGRPRGGYRGR